MHFCFLSLHSYPFLAGKNLGYGGGAEIEQVRLAKEFVLRGHQVDFVTYFEGMLPEEIINEIRIIKTYDRESRYKLNPILKFNKIYSALKKSESDIYFYEDGAPGAISLFSKIKGKKFVYRVASNSVALGKSLFKEKNFGWNLGNYFDLKNASAIISQNEFQKNELKKRFGVNSVLIGNGIPIPPINASKGDSPIVQWIGNVSENKDPLSFVELTRSLPNIQFEMIGGKVVPYDALYESLLTAIQKVKNLKYLGYVPNDEIDKFYCRASILVNTSYVEGFPNTFLEAWAHFTPVISYRLDPDSILRTKGIGLCSLTFRQLVADVSSLAQDKELRESMGLNGRRFVEDNYDLKKIASKYLKLFELIHTK